MMKYSAAEMPCYVMLINNIILKCNACKNNHNMCLCSYSADLLSLWCDIYFSLHMRVFTCERCCAYSVTLLQAGLSLRRQLCQD